MVRQPRICLGTRVAQRRIGNRVYRRYGPEVPRSTWSPVKFLRWWYSSHLSPYRGIQTLDYLRLITFNKKIAFVTLPNNVALLMAGDEHGPNSLDPSNRELYDMLTHTLITEAAKDERRLRKALLAVSSLYSIMRRLLLRPRA